VHPITTSILLWYTWVLTEMDIDYEICELLEELCEYCSSDELTLPMLQEKVKKLKVKFPLHQIKENYPFGPFFHSACLSKGITFEIVEYLLDEFPDAAAVESEDENDYDIGGDSVDTYEKFPLHLACYNQYCPSSIISLLIKRYSTALENFVPFGRLFIVSTYDEQVSIEGLPLHYYLARKSNIHIDTVKMLVDEYPQAVDADIGGLTPLHVIVSSPNENINNLLHIIKYLIEVAPSCVRTEDECERTPFLVASCNKNITLEVVQFLYNKYPEALRIPSESIGWLPIHKICQEKLIEGSSIEILRFMLDIDPGLVREMGDDEYLPIHYAIRHGNKSFEFCKVLIDAYPESLRVLTIDGMLPIHLAVYHSNIRDDAVDTIKYLLEIHPESINVRDSRGQLPIHIAAEGKRADIVELLLKHDPDAASKTTSLKRQLPMHLAARTGLTEVAEVLFDAYPESMNIRDVNGKTSLDLSWAEETRHSRDPNDSDVINFILTQQAYARQAQDIEAKTTIDNDDWLSLCCALKEKAPLGSIKLLLGALRSVGHTDPLPLNTDCEFSSIKVVLYLLELDNFMDEGLASMHLVHSACRGGNLEVVKYFLDEHISLVASAEVNKNGELPIHLLCEAGKDKVGNDDSIEYIEIIWRMLLANPEAVVGI